MGKDGESGTLEGCPSANKSAEVKEAETKAIFSAAHWDELLPAEKHRAICVHNSFLVMQELGLNPREPDLIREARHRRHAEEKATAKAARKAQRKADKAARKAEKKEAKRRERAEKEVVQMEVGEDERVEEEEDRRYPSRAQPRVDYSAAEEEEDEPSLFQTKFTEAEIAWMRDETPVVDNRSKAELQAQLAQVESALDKVTERIRAKKAAKAAAAARGEPMEPKAPESPAQDDPRKPHKCTYCRKAFAHSGNLKQHIRTHTGEKPFKCPDCDAAFTTSSHLKYHIRTHTGEKPYKCSDCDAAFAQLGDLKKHIRTHTGEKPFKCSECDAAFTTSGNLERHIQALHS